MKTPATFKICCNCGAKAQPSKRLCNDAKGCGPSSAQDRRAGRKSAWREPTADELAAKQAQDDRMEALLQSLIS